MFSVHERRYATDSQHSVGNILHLYRTKVTMWPFTGRTGHCPSLTDTFLPKTTETELMLARSLNCFFSTRTSSSCSRWGTRESPLLFPFMPFTPVASRRQLSRSEHLSFWAKQTTNGLSLVLHLTRQMSSIATSVFQPFVASSVPSSVRPSARWWDRVGTTELQAVYALQRVKQSLAILGNPVSPSCLRIWHTGLPKYKVLWPPGGVPAEFAMVNMTGILMILVCGSSWRKDKRLCIILHTKFWDNKLKFW